MSNPLFSIIIPTFNSAKTIAECLESIDRQVFKNIEVLIMDGKSEDSTIEIATAFKNKFQYIQIVSELDKGIYDAMNKGIKLAKGEWLYFLGSDDYLFDQNIFFNLANFLKGKDIGCIYGNVKVVETGKIHMGEIQRMNLFRKNISHQSMLIDRKVFEKIAFFDLQFPVFADLDFNFKLFFSDCKIQYVNLIFAYFRLGGTSSTPNANHVLEKKRIFKKAKSKLTYLQWIEFYLYFLKSRVSKYLNL